MAKQKSRSDRRGLKDSQSVNPKAQIKLLNDTGLPRSNLSECLDVESLCFFMNQYVMIPRHRETASGPLAALPRLYTTASADDALPAATQALALTRMARHTGREDCRLESIKKYGEAVIKVNQAIQDKDCAALDHLVQTVLMLGLWEVIDHQLAPLQAQY